MKIFDNLYQYKDLDFFRRIYFSKVQNTIDLDKYELFDLQKTAVRDVQYDEQENFYMGITSEADAETSSTSSAVEW